MEPLVKLESYTNTEMVIEEIKILTNLLEETTRRMFGDQAFEKIQELVALSKENNHQELEKEIENLTIDQIDVMARYFSILPLLINITEDVDLAYEVSYQNILDQDYLGKLSNVIDQVVKDKM